MSESIHLNSVIRRAEGLVSADLDQSKVLLSVEQSKYFGLNPVADQIWALLDSPRKVEDLCTQLRQEFDVSEEECRTDVLEFLHQLHNEKLIIATDEPA